MGQDQSRDLCASRDLCRLPCGRVASLSRPLPLIISEGRVVDEEIRPFCRSHSPSMWSRIPGIGKVSTWARWSDAILWSYRLPLYLDALALVQHSDEWSFGHPSCSASL